MVRMVIVVGRDGVGCIWGDLDISHGSNLVILWWWLSSFKLQSWWVVVLVEFQGFKVAWSPWWSLRL